MPALEGNGRLFSKSSISKAGTAELGVPGLEEYSGRVDIVSLRLSIGIFGSLSSFASKSDGSVACLPNTGFSPLRMAFWSAF